MVHLRAWHHRGAEAVVRGMILLLVGLLLASSVALLAPAGRAHADTPHRLDTFTNANGTIVHRWSDDGGTTWSAWTSLQPLPNGLTFVGTPTAVSDGIARLTVADRTSEGNLEFNTYNNGTWSGWNYVPGDTPDNPGGWAIITINHWCLCLPPLQQDWYQPIDAPVLTSWGTGRMELFVYALANGNTVLLHTWADGYTWSGSWEVLGVVGPGTVQGTPAAVSWGYGRTDVFMRGTSNELEHRWFDNGQWSPTWENLGTPTTSVTLGSSPAVTSSGVGALNLFVRGSDGNLWGTWYNGAWGGWSDIGCCLAGDVTDPVVAAYLPSSSLDVFVVGTLHDFYRKVYVYASRAWADWQFLDRSLNFTNIAATTWVPVGSDQPDPPTPTFNPNCGRAGQPPCPEEP